MATDLDKNLKSVLIAYIKNHKKPMALAVKRHKLLSLTLNRGYTLSNVNLSNNLIKSIPRYLIEDIFELRELNFSNNQIKSLPEDLFKNIRKIGCIDFSNNRIISLPNNLFQNKQIKSIDMSNNFIKEIPNDLFKGVKDLEKVNFSNNQIWSVSFDLFETNESNSLSKTKIDFRGNIKTNDVAMIFGHFFEILQSDEIDEKNIFAYRPDIMNSDEIDDEKVFAYRNLYLNSDENKLFLTRNRNVILLRNRILSFILNRSVLTFEQIIAKISSEIFVNLFEFKYSLLDFFLLNEEDFSLTSLWIIQFIQHIRSVSKNNRVENWEFKIRSPLHSFKLMCDRDDPVLFKTIFDYDYIHSEKYIYEFQYLDGLLTAIGNDNQQMAIVIFNIFLENFQDINLDFIKYESLVTKIFEKKWYDLIRIILDNAKEKNDYLKLNKSIIENFNDSSTKPNSLTVYDDEMSLKFSAASIDCKIFELITESKKTWLLTHPTTREMVHTNWESMPRFLYYFLLFLYVIFIISYSLTSIDNGSYNTLTVFCSFGLVIFFALLEILELGYYISKKNTIGYIKSIKNDFEAFTFTICIVTLTFKIFYEIQISFLYSLSVLLAYFVLIFRLNKSKGVGQYLGVFSKIIVRAFKFSIIPLICLIGFLFSFKNLSNKIIKRNVFSNYSNLSTQSNFSKNDNQTDYSIVHFESSFSLSIFKLLIMLIGNLETTNMGIDTFSWDSIINFVIYGCFIFVMPILLLNIFTGISIDEVKNMFDNSLAESVEVKIEYIKKVKFLMHKLDKFYKKVRKNSKLKKKNGENNFFSKLPVNIRSFVKISGKKNEIDEEKKADLTQIMEELKTLKFTIQNIEENIKEINKKISKI